MDQKTPDDIAQLRDQFPGWQIGTVWTSAASGPDARRFFASKGVILISSWTAGELATLIRAEEG